MRILFVENHARFARIVTSQFLSQHDVTIVSSLATAREALGQNSYGALLIDYDLDDGKGDTLVSECSALSPRPFIIAVSSHDAGNSAIMESGADLVCSKMQFGNIVTVLDSLQQKQT